jgi:hypothetical protein
MVVAFSVEWRDYFAICNLVIFIIYGFSVNGNTLLYTFALSWRLLSSLTISISAVSSSSALQNIMRKIRKKTVKSQKSILNCKNSRLIRMGAIVLCDVFNNFTIILTIAQL